MKSILLELLFYPVLFTFLQHKCYLISRITEKLIKWLLVVINRLSVIICHIFHIVFHKLQLVLTVNSSLIQKFCFSLFLPLPTACVWYFFKIIFRRLSSTFHLLYLDQNETQDCVPKWKTHSSLFLQSSSSTCKELPDDSSLLSFG